MKLFLFVRMKKHILKRFGKLILTAGFFLVPSAVFACSCIVPPDTVEGKAAREHIDIAFEGWAVSENILGSDYGAEIFTDFTVDKWIKGDNGSKRVTLRTKEGSRSCGYGKFAIGDYYRIYGSESDLGYYTTDVCSFNERLTNEFDVQEVSDKKSDEQKSIFIFILSGVFILLLAAFTYTRKKNKIRKL